MGKAGKKVVQLSERELQRLCEEAVDRGVSKYIAEDENRRKNRPKGLLHNTKVLLENYRKLKDYLEKAEVSLYEIVQENYPDYSIEMLEVFGLTIEDRRSYTLAKGVATVKILMNHIDRMLEVYKADCESSPNPIYQRRWEVIERMYIREQKMTTKEIAEEFCVEPRSIQEDAKRAREDLKTLFFGIEALIWDMVQ